MAQVGVLVTSYCLLSCQDVEGVEETGALLFQKRLSSETILVPLALRSGSLVSK